MIVQFPIARTRLSRLSQDRTASVRAVHRGSFLDNPDGPSARDGAGQIPASEEDGGFMSAGRQRIRAMSREDLDRPEARSREVERRLKRVRRLVASDPSFVSAAAAFLNPLASDRLLEP